MKDMLKELLELSEIIVESTIDKKIMDEIVPVVKEARKKHGSTKTYGDLQAIYDLLDPETKKKIDSFNTQGNKIWNEDRIFRNVFIQSIVAANYNPANSIKNFDRALDWRIGSSKSRTGV